MYLHVRMYVGTLYVCMYMYMYVCMYMYMYVCMYVYMYVCMCVHVCMYMYMYVCMYVHVHVCMYVCMCTCMYVCTCTCMYMYMYVCMYVCTCTCMYVCMYVYMYEIQIIIIVINFYRVTHLLDSICSAIPPSSFAIGLWNVLLHSPITRQPAAGYILSHLNKGKSHVSVTLKRIEECSSLVVCNNVNY